MSEAALKQWKVQHIGQPEWVNHYWKSRELPSREIVLRGLLSLSPWKTLAELGCHCGPMLATIQKEFPEAHLTGVEPNLVAAQACRDNLGEQVPVFYGTLQEWLAEAPPTDVLVSHYTLAYISPEEIRPVLADMCRVAQKGLVLAEPMGAEVLIYNYPEWGHDYVTHLTSLGLTEFYGANVPKVNGGNHLNGVLVAKK